MNNCLDCGKTFIVTEQELSFLRQVDLPTPKKCFHCRHKERISWRNERSLYHRVCQQCKKPTIACYSEESRIPIYCNTCWWGDTFNAFAYGKEFDFSRPFFEQFSELEKSIPHFALFQDPTSENCQYTNYGLANKSCYMALCYASENIYYGHGVIQSKDCVDVTKVQQCELCYECVDCTSCNRLLFSKNCFKCDDSAFLINCRNSSDCFGSINLNQKQYVWMNQQLTKEEYQQRKEKLVLTPEKIIELQKSIQDQSAQAIHRSYFGINNTDSVGDYLDNCDNVYFCFDGIGLKDSAFCDFTGVNSYQLYDCTYGGIDSADCYQSMGFTNFNTVLFQIAGRNVFNSVYSQYCYSSHDLFGSIGINHGQYVIFNKQYSVEEYTELKQRIIAHMKKTGEWGQFFPMKYSPHAYNETLAHEYYPLEKEQVLKQELRWKDREDQKQLLEQSAVVQCEHCNRNFQVIDQEQIFYKKMLLPLPKWCPDCRHRRRFLLRRPRELWVRQCAQCRKSITTAFSPETTEIIYCEKCYGETFY